MPNGTEKFVLSNNWQTSKIVTVDLFNFENNLIGNSTLIVNTNTNHAILESIDIEKKYQKQGYGSLLIFKIFEICHDKKVTKLALCSDLEQENLDQFYKKLGFEQIPITDENPYDYEINIPKVRKQQIESEEQIEQIQDTSAMNEFFEQQM